MPDVVCVGIMIADILARPLDHLPPRGAIGLIEEIGLQAGGCAINTAVGLARIGFSVALVGKVGADYFGDFLTSYVRKEGVDISGVARDCSIHTSAAIALVHGDGERSFLHSFGANAALGEADLDFALIRRARLLHIAGSLLLPKLDGEPTARLLERAKQAGLLTSLDTVWDPRGRWMEVLRPCLPHVDYFLPSLEEARRLTGRNEPAEVAEGLLDSGVGTVVLKMGRQGCYLRTREARFAIPAYQIQCVDGTGAGDAFVAGFLAAVLKGWDLETSGRFANAAGALACLAVGATAGIGSLQGILDFQRAASRGKGADVGFPADSHDASPAKARRSC